jgi:hypothetical protein
VSAEISFLGTLGTLSVIILFFILVKLSERLGSVQRMPESFRYYYIALFFLTIGYLTHVVIARVSFTPEDFPSWLNSSWFQLLAYHLPLSIGVTIGLIVTWCYWSWLITER